MISFVGAGPGAPDLITLRGAERLADAEVVIWASSLVPEAVLQHCRTGAAVHDSATMTLEDVIARLRRPPGRDPRSPAFTPAIRASTAPSASRSTGADRHEPRLGDRARGCPRWPAAAAALGQELTQPGVAQSVVLTRLAGRTQASMPPGESVAAFAAHGATMAVFLSAARPDELAAELLAAGSGYDPGTPAAIVVRATWPDERVIRTTVGDLAGDLRATGTTLTVLVLVGDALAEGPVARRSHLYAPGYSTAYRLRSRAGLHRRPALGAPPAADLMTR